MNSRTGMKPMLLLSLLCTAMALPSQWGHSAEPTNSIRIVKDEKGFHLERNGKPYFIKGAVGAYRLDLLAASGGNSVRARGESLDGAHKLGLTCLVGLPLRNPRHGFDYSNQARVEEQFNNARRIVEKYKDHPALLLWAIGNEPEIQTTPEQRIPVWREVNRIAEMVHQVDGHHPVITVLGDAYRRMLSELNEYCPALDAVGLNSYKDMLTLPEDIQKQGWSRPYVVTEFGPRGHWQVARTPWRVPLEDNSSEKAKFYLDAYGHSVASPPQCLGAYAFYWSHKQEKTHTWYGMFLPDGSHTAAMDTMQYVWTGSWPTNRCPEIGPGKITIASGDSATPVTVTNGLLSKPGALLRASVEVRDPDGDPLKIEWDLRRDVADNPNVGGDYEPATPPLQGVILGPEANPCGVRLKLPDTPGKYRLFVYAYDGHGNAATANVPILAAEPKPQNP